MEFGVANLELSRIWSFQKWSFRPANLELESDSRKSGVDSRFVFWPKTRFGVGVDLTPENMEFNSRKSGVELQKISTLPFPKIRPWTCESGPWTPEVRISKRKVWIFKRKVRIPHARLHFSPAAPVGCANPDLSPANLEFGPAENLDLGHCESGVRTCESGVRTCESGPQPCKSGVEQNLEFSKMEFGVANLELESDSRKSGVDSRFGFWPKTRFGVGVDLTPENLEFWNFEKMEFWSSESGVGVWVWIWSSKMELVIWSLELRIRNSIFS